MKRAEANKYGAALAAAGVIDSPAAGGKLPRALRSVHGPASITGNWTETTQRRAPQRVAVIVCVDVAEAMLDGWSVDALRACTHTPDRARIAAVAAVAA